MNISFRELKNKFKNLKRRMRLKMTLRDVFVCLFFVILFGVGYLCRIGFLIYKSMKYDSCIIDAINLNLDEKSVYLHMTIKNAIPPFDINVGNIVVEMTIFGERIGKILSKKDLKFKKGKEVFVKHTFDILNDGNYSFSKLRGIKNLKDVNMRVKMTLKKRICFINASYRTKFTYTHEFEKNEEEKIIVDDIKINAENRFVDVRLFLKPDFFSMNFKDFQFDLTIHELSFATVKCSVHPEKGYHAHLVFSQQNSINFATQFRRLLENKSTKISFSNFIFNAELDINFRYMLINVILSSEIITSSKSKQINMIKIAPVMEFNIKKIIPDKIQGELSIHSSLLNNFIPCSYFLNKISVSPQAKLGIYSLSKNQPPIKVANVILDLKNRVDYLCFDFVLELLDPTTFFESLVAQHKNTYLKISCINDDIVGEYLGKVNFIWDYFNEFNFTYNNFIQKKEDSQNNTDIYELNTFKSICSFDQRETLIISNLKMILPLPLKPGAHILISWPKFNIILKFKGVHVLITAKKSHLNLKIDDFIHKSDIFRSQAELNFIIQVNLDYSNYIDWIRLQNTLTNFTTTIQFKFQICEKRIKNGLYWNFKHVFKKNRVLKEEPFISRVLSQLNFQFSQLFNFSHLQINLIMDLLTREERFYRILFDITLPAIKMSLIFNNNSQPFAIVETPLSSLKFNISNGDFYHLVVSTDQSDMFPVDIKFDWMIIQNFIEINNKEELNTQNGETSGKGWDVNLKGLDNISMMIASIVNQINFRNTKVSQIKLKNRDTYQGLLFNDNSLKISNQSTFNDFKIYGVLTFLLPRESLIDQGTQANVVKVTWDNAKIILEDSFKHKIYLTIMQGSICIKIDNNRDNYQDQGKFVVKYEIDKNFDYKCSKSIIVENKGKGIVNTMPISKKITNYFQRILESDSSYNHFDHLKIIENFRNICKIDGLIQINTLLSLIYSDVSNLHKIDDKLCYIISKLNLVTYPSYVDFDFENICDGINSNLLKKSFSGKCDLSTRVNLSYKKEDRFKDNEIILDTKIDMRMSDFIGIKTDPPSSGGIISFLKSIPNQILNISSAFTSFMQNYGSLFYVTKDDSGKHIFNFVLPLQIDLSKTVGKLCFYKESELIATAPLNTIIPAVYYNKQSKIESKGSLISIFIESSNFIVSGTVRLVYVNSDEIETDLYNFDFEKIPRPISMLINSVGIDTSLKLLSFVQKGSNLTESLKSSIYESEIYNNIKDKTEETIKYVKGALTGCFDWIKNIFYNY